MQKAFQETVMYKWSEASNSNIDLEKRFLYFLPFLPVGVKTCWTTVHHQWNRGQVLLLSHWCTCRSWGKCHGCEKLRWKSGPRSESASEVTIPCYQPSSFICRIHHRWDGMKTLCLNASRGQTEANLMSHCKAGPQHTMTNLYFRA